LATALLAAMALLSGCGGGGDAAPPVTGGDAPPVTGGDAPPKASGILLSGVVAVGEPLVGAAVASWCSDGKPGPGTTTDTTGSYTLEMPADCAAPWLLRASGGTPAGSVLYSFTDRQPSGAIPSVPLNVTPLTTLLVQLTSARLPGVDVSAATSIAPGFMALLATNKADIETLINRWRPSTFTGWLTVDDILAKVFVTAPGDPIDDLLQAISRMRGNVSQAALLEQLSPKGGSLAGGQPWQALFGTAGSRTFSGVDCTGAFGNPVGPATLTLRTDASGLQVEMASDLFGAPATFTVGAAVSSDFQLKVRGDSPLVQISASSSGSNFSLFTDAGVAKVSLSSQGAFASCTLSNPVLRADLVAFEPAARILSVVPPGGASGSCAASAAGPAYTYEISKMGDVRIDGTSLPQDWLNAPEAYYSESLQFGMFGPEPSYQVQLSASPTAQGIQPYYFSTVPYAVNCTSYNP
jgi:hypothetical protein